MTLDAARLRIDRLIIHDVPKRFKSDTEADLTLSEVESELDDELRLYFRERIAETLKLAASSVEEDDDAASPVPEQIRMCLADSSDLVVRSQAMARHLYTSQSGNNSAGLLVVLTASINAAPFLSVLKLQRESGVQLRAITLDGKATFTLQQIRQLMLTDQTKVFKAGVFWDQDSTLVGSVSDRQRGLYGTGVAEFFLRFLGFRLTVNSDVMTERVYKTATDHINSKVESPEAQGRYITALLTEMNSHSTTISPVRFASDHLDPEHRQGFLDALRDEGIGIASFTKDLTLVKSQLHRVKIDFRSGIRVLAPPGTDDHMTMTDMPNGDAQLVITDEVREVGTSR